MTDDAVADDTDADDAAAPDVAAGAHEPEEQHPRGTLVIASLFLVALVITWVAMYFMMLSRS